MNLKLSRGLLLSFATLVAAAAVIIGATFAAFSDTETSQGNTFEAGVLDLKIDNTSFYNGNLNPDTTWELDELEGKLFFEFLDVKPGDWGEDTISIHVNNNNAWACFDTALTSDDDVSSNEPELLGQDAPEDTENDFDGELGQNLNFSFWVDDGDNVYETGEEIIVEGTADELLDGLSVTLADSLSNLFEENGPLIGAETYYIAKAWCFGEFVLTPVAQDGVGSTDNPETDGYDGTNGPDVRNDGISCDGSELDNTIQTDTLTADVLFTAVQHRNNPDFTCDVQPSATPTNTPSPTLTPTPTTPISFACTSVDNIFASGFQDNDQGLRKDSTAVLANRSVPSAAFGAPQTTGADSDAGVVPGSFFSLGFPLGGNTASIVYTFAEPFYNGPGNDLQIYEVTGGTYPDEKVKIEASPDGVTWTVLAAAAIRDEAVDLGVLTSAQYVRLTDVSDINLFTGTGDNTPDGYDLDAIRAFCTQSNVIQGGQ